MIAMERGKIVHLLRRRIKKIKKWSERCRKEGLVLRLAPNYNGKKQLYLVAPEGFILGVSADVHGIEGSPQKAWDDFFGKINQRGGERDAIKA